MKYFKFILIYLIVVSCSGVNKKKVISGNVTDIEVNIEEAEESYMSNYFSSIEYIHLNSPDERPFGRVAKIMMNNNNIALFDKSRGSVWIYTMEGEFLNEVVVPRGRGPGELTSINDVVYTDNNKIHFLGRFKIVEYNVRGEFQEHTQLNFYIYNFTYDENTDQYIGYASNSLNQGRINNHHGGSNLFFIGKDGKINSSYLPIDDGKEQMGFSVPNNFPTYKDQQLFFAHLVDTVYSIDKGNVIARYHLDFGKNSIPKNIFQVRDQYSTDMYEWDEFQEEEIEDKNYASFISVFAESNKYVYFRFMAGTNLYGAIYDKEAGETHTIEDKLVNDIDYGMSSYIYEGYDNALYSVVYPDRLINHLDEVKKKRPNVYKSAKMEEIRNVRSSIGDNKNPIVMIAKFK